MSNDVTLQALLQELAKIRDVDFRGYKPASLERRLKKRLGQLNLKTYAEYVEHLRNNTDEVNQLLKVVLINVTEFFRDPPAWEALRTEALPLLLKNRKPGDSFRAWCAGCSTGEEAYSLVILLAEELGPSLKDYDLKIYATDHDEDALNVARRGEYPLDKLTRVRPEWREKYFEISGNSARIRREIRKLVIFGRSNLASEAPVSHVHLLICRNVLIYFDVALQKQLLERFRFALEPGGILFLGKAESQLRGIPGFQPLNNRWRIFQVDPKEPPLQRPAQTQEEVAIKAQEYEQLRLLHQYLFETIRPGVLVLDNKGVITTGSDAAVRIWGISGVRLIGKGIEETPLVERSPELREHLERIHSTPGDESIRFHSAVQIGDEERVIEVTIRPILNHEHVRTGTFVYAEDVTAQERLRKTVEELERTSSELHSTNEELETANEELQSANEELETTNEELQSANEELETTNEELHSLNEELETTNEELERRTRDLEEMTARYAETLEQMPVPAVLANELGEITVWNSAAEKLFGLSAKTVVGLKLEQLSIDDQLRKMLTSRHKSILASQNPGVSRQQSLATETTHREVTVRFAPITIPGGRSVLIVFDPYRLVVPVNTKKQPSRNARQTEGGKRAQQDTARSRTKAHRPRTRKR